MKTKLTVAAVAKRYGIGIKKVIAWIKSGELKAINVALKIDARKPRYLIDEADLEAFEQARRVIPETPKVKRTSRPPLKFRTVFY